MFSAKLELIITCMIKYFVYVFSFNILIIAFDYILRYLTVFPELKKYRINNYKRCIDGKMKIQLKMGWDEVKINYSEYIVYHIKPHSQCKAYPIFQD